MDTLTDLALIFNALKELLQPYSPPLATRLDDARHFELWSLKPVVIEGRKRSEVYFAAIIIQKGYVGFYFMPIYSNPGMKTLFQPELLSCLKGKSCFHIKRLDAQLLEQVRQALQDGYALYRERGWV